jgi:hypothetical protein
MRRTFGAPHPPPQRVREARWTASWKARWQSCTAQVHRRRYGCSKCMRPLNRCGARRLLARKIILTANHCSVVPEPRSHSSRGDKQAPEGTSKQTQCLSPGPLHKIPEHGPRSSTGPATIWSVSVEGWGRGTTPTRRRSRRGSPRSPASVVSAYLRTEVGTDSVTGKPTLSWLFDADALAAGAAGTRC